MTERILNMHVSSTYSLFVYIWSFGVDLNKIEFIFMSENLYKGLSWP